ncbi:MAG: polysaccharide biosynthesis tyrosine autokinase [Clostridia bacterium]|nr:polysaccharide biosynthesis tyrosine autokinase [Clostridia bacterium]
MSEYTSSRRNDEAFEEKSTVFMFNPKDLLRIVFKWWIVILVVGLCVGIISFFYGRISYAPTYKAQATMIVSTSNSPQQSYSNLYAARNLTNSYQIVLKSTVLMEEIAKDLQLDISASTLKNYISISSLSGTEIMRVSVVTPNANLSVQIANSFVKLSQKVIDEKLGVGYIFSLDPATHASMSSIRQNATKKGLTGFGVGALLCAVILIAIELLRDTIKTSDDIAEKLHMRTFGVVPVYKKRMQINGKEIIPLIDSPSAEFAFIEAYKNIRARIETNHARTGKKRIVVSSAVEKEGKTTVSVNIAMSLVQAGKKVILIDADLRKPSVNTKLGLRPHRELGLRAILEGTSTLQESIIHDEIHKLDVILCGRTSQSPSELLASDAMTQMLEELDQMYDYIIIDSPPSSFLTDAVLLSRLCDLTLLIVKHDYLPREIIRRTIDEYLDAGTKIDGVILNSVGYSTSGLGYYRYGSNYYGSYRKRKYYSKYYSKYND